MESLDKVLKRFRTEPPLADPASLTDEEKEILCAWRTYPAKLSVPMFLGRVPEHAPNQWKYAWTFRQVDWNDFARRVSSIDPVLLREIAQKLISARLIFPDGTVHPAANPLL